MNSTAAGTLAIATITLTGCIETTDTDPCAMHTSPRTDRMVVLIPPGGSTSVSISGIPPFSISSPPDPGIADAEFVDSTVSPAFVAITAPPTAMIGEQTYFTIADECLPLAVSIMIGTNTAISYSDNIQPIWDGNCQNRGCHPGGGAPFSLDRFVSWSNLWYAAATNMNCGAIYRVVGGIDGGPGNPDSSLVYLVVSGRTSCPRMPFSPTPGDTLSLIEQDMIKTWIVEGGQNN